MHKRMRAILHKIKRIILILATFALLFVIGLICWYKFAWPRFIDKDEIILLADTINNSSRLPDNFYKIYDHVYPKQRRTRILKTYVWGGLKTYITAKRDQKLISPTYYASRLYFMNFPTDKKLSRKKSYWIYLSFALDKYTTPEKCFDYYIVNYDFLYNQIGIAESSRFYYDKSLDDLADIEIIGLIVMLENPVLYNPKRNPDRYQLRVKYYLEKL